MDAAAYDLNTPLRIAWPTGAKGDAAVAGQPFVRTSGARVICETLKPGRDGSFILRLFEPDGLGGPGRSARLASNRRSKSLRPPGMPGGSGGGDRKFDIAGVDSFRDRDAKDRSRKMLTSGDMPSSAVQRSEHLVPKSTAPRCGMTVAVASPAHNIIQYWPMVLQPSRRYAIQSGTGVAMSARHLG